MSYDLRFAIKTKIAGVERYICVGSPELDTPTYNIGAILRQATGLDFKQSEYYKCSEIFENVVKGAAELELHGDKYRKLEPPNGWGTVENAINVLNGLKRDMKELSEERDIPLEELYIAW